MANVYNKLTNGKVKLSDGLTKKWPKSTDEVISQYKIEIEASVTDTGGVDFKYKNMGGFQW